MRYIIALLTLLLIAGCATQVADTTTSQPDDPQPIGMDSEQSEPDVTFQLTGEDFLFRMDGQENPTLTVSKGDLVRIEFESTDGFHDWVLGEFNAQTTRVRPGDGMVSVEFVADAAGEYNYYCSVGQHRAAGMEGVFIVE